jgi:hypothetical protein
MGVILRTKRRACQVARLRHQDYAPVESFMG